MTTHEAAEGDLQKALKEISALDGIEANPVCLRIIEEHPESII